MSTDSPLFLAIDQGGHSTRVVVADDEGRQLASYAAPVATARDGERVEQQAEELLESVLGGLRTVAEELGGRAGEVIAAGLAVQRASVVCWDRETGAALSPALSWMDRRGVPQLEAAALDPGAVHERTGLYRSPHYGAAKLAWCLQELPAVRRAADAGRLGLGPLSSYLVWQLSGGESYRVDATTAQRTLLWDRHARDWSPELCRAFGVPIDALPRVVDCDSGFGELALGDGAVPLTRCAGDQGLVPGAYGAADASTVCVNAGTGAFVLMPVTGERLSERGLLLTLAWSGRDGPRWVEEGTVNGAASALTRAHAGDLPVEPGDGDGGYFLNGVGGLGSPWWIPDYPSRFLGDGGEPAERERLVLESIVYLIMANVARLQSAPERLLLTGGLSQRVSLCQWLADALGLPVDVPEDREATLRGTLAALSPAIAATDPAFHRAEPDGDAGARWRERQARWEELLLEGV